MAAGKQQSSGPKESENSSVCGYGPWDPALPQPCSGGGRGGQFAWSDCSVLRTGSKIKGAENAARSGCAKTVLERQREGFSGAAGVAAGALEDLTSAPKSNLAQLQVPSATGKIQQGSAHPPKSTSQLGQNAGFLQTAAP